MKDPLVVNIKTPPPPEHVAPLPPRLPRPRKRRSLSKVVGVLILIACAIGVWWLWGDSESTSIAPQGVEQLISPTQDAAQSEGDLIAEVGKLIMLPEGENPTIATVTDPQKLQDQVFFANAKQGHRVLIYTRAQKAYLYDPVAKRLVEVAPLTVQAQ